MCYPAHMANKFERYGLLWEPGTNDLQVEIECIKRGGQWMSKGAQRGAGLYHHYERMRQLLWPRLDTHRWHTLCLSEIVKNKVTVLMGPKSSAKTHEASGYGLCYYFVDPDNTCVLVSSTDIRGLKMRVWGEITMLWQQAIERYDWLPGHFLESKIAITTDALDDGDLDKRTVRDMRKAIIGIPCIQGGKFVGLGKYCFASGTLVDTVFGPTPIEEIRTGDFVWCLRGFGRVEATSKRFAPQLVRVHLRDGSHIDCTPDHPFLTSMGWKNAIDILPESMLISSHDKLRGLWEEFGQVPRSEEILLDGVPNVHLEKEMLQLWQGVHPIGRKGSVLLSELCSRLEMDSGGNGSQNGSERGHQAPWGDDLQKSYGQPIGAIASKQAHEESHHRNPCQTPSPGFAGLEWLWHWSQGHANRTHHESPLPRGQTQLCDTYRQIIEAGGYSHLLDRLRLAGTQTCCRDRRFIPPSSIPAEARFPEGLFPESKTVDRVEVLDPTGDSRYNLRAGGYPVHNLQVDSHPSFSVNGLIVHNCGIKQKRVLLIADELQFMGPSFLSAFSNLDANENFQAICLGNPNDIVDQLGRAAEPLEGWGTHMEPEKTEVWNTRFMGGRCVNLIGTDSPNFDYPESEPIKYKYLINRKSIANTAAFFGKESQEFYSQCKGCMKISQLARRVITRDICVQGHAFDDVVWEGGSPVRIGALDAAYGGDRCVAGYVEFGKEVGGKVILNIHPPQIVPVKMSAEVPVEHSIAEWCKDYFVSNRVDPSNFYHDSTGRGSLGTYFARVWSDQCNPVEFGGSPTDRPVSLDMYITDPKTRARRLMMCSEHYRKFVTELWFSVRYAIEAGQIRNLPEDVMEEGCMREWNNTNDDKKELETKVEMKERVGRSPDLFDWLAIAVEGARRRGFMISKLANDEESVNSTDWMKSLGEAHRKMIRSKDLRYEAA